ncbi:MAG TPA: lasso peptide biosynthesis B2 protein [Allosphingosinicella sp.]
MLLVEALLVLAGASLAIKLLPFRWVASAAGRQVDPRSDDWWTVKKVRWAVNATAQRVFWKAVCFQRGLAVHVMLRRRGIPSVLHYGVAKPRTGRMAAHVWVTVGGRSVVGGEEAADYACVGTFPPGGVPIR